MIESTKQNGKCTTKLVIEQREVSLRNGHTVDTNFTQPKRKGNFL